MCAVRAIRSALVARLPLLAGLRLFDLLVLALLVLADDFVEPDLDVEAWLVPDFAFELPDAPVLPFAVLSLVDVDGVAADFCPSEACPATGNTSIMYVRTAATHRVAIWPWGCWRDVALIFSLYLYLFSLDVPEPMPLPLRPRTFTVQSALLDQTSPRRCSAPHPTFRKSGLCPAPGSVTLIF